MVSTILGRKLGMTQIWDEDDNVVPVTVIQAGPCTVSQVKTKATDGYGRRSDRLRRHLRQARQQAHGPATSRPPAWSPCATCARSAFENGEEHKTGDGRHRGRLRRRQVVDVIGTSKGKGFQGTIKRWNFSRGPMTHGSRNQRKPGSIGQCAYPARVRKGLHMYGHNGRRARDGQEPQARPHRRRAEPSCSSRALSPAARTHSSRSAWPKCPENVLG